MIFGKRCKTCDAKLSSNGASTIRLNTADGIIELEICDECSHFFDKSADVISKGRGSEDEDESL